MKRKMKLDETAEKVLRLELAYGVHLYKKGGLLVVTRHKALVDLLREKGIISGDCDYMEHAGVDDVQGRDVVGNLPLHLAAHCHTITSVAMSVPLEMRGRELTLDELREVYRGVHTYRVEEVK